ncbi:hypothetical protein TNCV_2169101 [Trichonephila clavipes]|nr:hypothetical protein TNCV_2169101 [Trichonephila clavipes]
MFLAGLDTHHRDVSAFSRIALQATFSTKLLFIPVISLLINDMAASSFLPTDLGREDNLEVEHPRSGALQLRSWTPLGCADCLKEI